MRRFFLLFQIILALLIVSLVISGRLQARTYDLDLTEDSYVFAPVFTPTDSATSLPGDTSSTKILLPVILTSPPSSLPPPVRITEDQTIDFIAVKAKAQADGKDAAPNKIGFHVGVGGNREGLIDSIVKLDNAGIPVFLKTANDAEPLWITQEMMKLSGVPHTLVYRDVAAGIHESDYDRPPKQAAQDNWQFNVDRFPPELDPTLVWLETINEPDKNRTSWLAEFSLEQAKLAVAGNYRYAAFSWSSGEPEPYHWEVPEMLDFLRYAAEHPENVAVALHEYSFESEFISSEYPWRVGRFQKLFAICDKHSIPRPTVLISEWGWVYDDVPSPDEAMKDIEWASWLYAAYPQVKGAAIWYLGEGDNFGSIEDKAQKLIAPVHDFSEVNYFIIHTEQLPIDESIFEPNPPTFDNR